jgi:hypothetical protein
MIHADLPVERRCPDATLGATMKPEQLRPLAYHHAMADHLQTHHRAVWDSFHAALQSGSRRADVELFLLKSSYRLSEQDHPDLHAWVSRARSVLGVEQPISLYQSHKGHADNASMSFTAEQGHLRFEGEILANLTPDETAALIGHEIGHYKLWASGDGACLTTARILDAMAAERDVHPSLVESQRLHHLYTEIFCDRAGALVAGKAEPMVSTLVKLDTGEVRVSAEHFLAQAEEIFRKSAAETSQGKTHPEHFIRARAIARWWADPGSPAVDRLVEDMIEGPKPLDALDVLGRARLTRWTRSLVHRLARLVQPPQDSAWARHRERFLPLETERGGPASPAEWDAAELRSGLERESPTVRDYFAFLLLDFAAIDPERRDAPRRCRELAAEIGLEHRFAELAQEHLAPRDSFLPALAQVRAA